MNVSDDLLEDIGLARKVMLSENYSYVIIKDGKILKFNRETGIKPVLSIIDEMGDDLEGTVVGERIIGKASAFLWRYSKIRGVYSPQATKTAIAILIIGGIPCQADEMIPFIAENNYDNSYFYEEMLQNIESPEEAYKILKENVIKV